ncbi:MAG: bacteriocin [Spirochaetota bacterium]|nr:bacteriocin [Spirochaetota bacterium]
MSNDQKEDMKITELDVKELEKISGGAVGRHPSQ